MPNEPNFAELMRLANSPAGRQLISMLQQQRGDQLQSAMDKAAAGDYSQARNLITEFLENPEAKSLLEQLGGKK